jgi:hypothetical protein
MDYFKNLLDLLKIERNEDREQYKRLTESSSVADRRANGLTWFPVAIRGSEIGRGDYLTIELERTTKTFRINFVRECQRYFSRIMTHKKIELKVQLLIKTETN